MSEPTVTEAWLASKGATLWANWSIEDPAERRVAAEWFDRQFDEFMDYVMALDEIPERVPAWPAPTLADHEIWSDLTTKPGPGVPGLPGTNWADPEYQEARRLIRTGAHRR